MWAAEGEESKDEQYLLKSMYDKVPRHSQYLDESKGLKRKFIDPISLVNTANPNSTEFRLPVTLYKYQHIVSSQVYNCVVFIFLLVT